VPGKFITNRRTERLPWQPKAELAPQGCKDDEKRSADSRLAVVIEVNDNVTTEVGNESISPEIKDSVTTEMGSENVFSEVNYGNSMEVDNDSISTEVSDDISAEINDDSFSAEKFPKVQKINQVGGKCCHPVSRMNITDDQEGCSSDHIHSECNLSYDCHGREVHFPFIIYVLCDQLKDGMGNALIDTRSQVSLVKETGLARGVKIKRQVMQIHSITGNVMETKGKVDLCIGETSLHEFMLVGDLPMKCDILLGQDWLERFGYQFQIPELGINLPAYSETLVRIPTTGKGSRLLEAEELQENIFCA